MGKPMVIHEVTLSPTGSYINGPRHEDLAPQYLNALGSIVDDLPHGQLDAPAGVPCGSVCGLQIATSSTVLMCAKTCRGY
jgi:hypothetical protein